MSLIPAVNFYPLPNPQCLLLFDAGEPTTQAARDLGMFRATLYRRIRELPSVTA